MNFSQLSILLVISSLFGIVARFLKQPLLIGFLFAGFFLSTFNLVSDPHVFELMGKIGVALLLFLVGIEMNIKDLSVVGKPALVTSIGQVVFTVITSFTIAKLIGFDSIVAIYIAVALSFSSTIIIVKLLSEKKDMESLYGKISVGFLLIQDFIAVLILMVLAGVKSGGSASFLTVLWLLIKAGVLFYLVVYLSKKILPNIFAKVVGHSQELLFIVSIAWALGLASLIGGPLGFSFEIGGFLAGLALSNLPEHFGVASKMRPLRDFFLTIFFISLGSQLVVTNILSVLPTAILFSLVVLIGNPLIVMVLMGLLGHKSRTSFFASVTVAQISEFSFILMSMGKSLGHVSDSNLALIVMVGALTMTFSTYLILGSEKIYNKIKHILSVFERKNTHESVFKTKTDFKDHVVIVGCDKIGNIILPYFVKRKIPVVVVDFNPSVFNTLTSNNIEVVLGDIADVEIQENVKLSEAKLIVSTIPSLEENLSIISLIKSLPKKPIYVGSSLSREDTIKLYESGADYVLNPDIVAGEFLRHVFVNHGVSSSRITKMGKSNFNRIMYLSKKNA